MKLVEKTVLDFVNEVDSSSPAPGGGSVSALAGSLGTALARMVGHLTVGKKAYRKLTEEQQQNFEVTLQQLEDIKDQLNVLIDEDTEAFNQIMAAFKMPKETDEDKKARKEAIEEATKGAIEVPMKVALLSAEALDILDVVLEFGNKNCTSDVGVAVTQLIASVQGALMNVKINLPGLSDEEEKQTLQQEADELFASATQKASGLLLTIYKKL